MRRNAIATLVLAFAALAAPSVARASVADEARPLHRSVSAGGTSDILARTIGQKLGDVLGQTIVVENKPGANGNVGAEFVAKSPPDGYTFLLADIGAIAISPSVYPTLPFDPVKDFSPVTMVAYSPHILAVHPSVPAQSVAELIALAKAKPGKLNYAHRRPAARRISPVSSSRARSGVDWAYIPYKGGAQAITDVVGGQADVLFNGILATPHVKSGKLAHSRRVEANRVSRDSGRPTVAESGLPGFETGSWQGILAPPGTPRDIVAKLGTEVGKILQTPEMKENWPRRAPRCASCRPTNSPHSSAALEERIGLWFVAGG